MTLHLGCGGSLEYLPHTAAMVHSALSHAGEDVQVHYLHGPELPRETARRFAEMVAGLGGTLNLHEIADERIAGLPRFGEAPPKLWYRVFMPELLGDVQRILYLDGDTVVLDSLQPLWETDLQGNVLGAVTNVFAPWDAGYPASLGLPKPYFNSGVLLIDLERMRAEDGARRVLEHALANAHRLPFADQDSLNIVLGDRRLELHPRWNCMTSVLVFEAAVEAFGAEAVAEAQANPAIRHFEGPSTNKPWHVLSESDGREAYRHHRRQTPWPRYRPDGLTAANVARRMLRAVRS